MNSAKTAHSVRDIAVTSWKIITSTARRRRTVIALVNLVLIILSSYLAISLRFDGRIPTENWIAWASMLPWLLAIRVLVFVPFRLYEGMWRYTSLWDVRNIVGGVTTSSVLFYVVAHWVFGATLYPRSVFIVDAVLLIVFSCSIRLTRRIMREASASHRNKRVLIFGAGDAGEMIVRDMRNNAFYDVEPVAFVDDNQQKVGQRIRGIPVMGTRADLPRVMAACKPTEVLIAIPTASPAILRGIVRALEPFKVSIKTLPNLRDILDGRVEVSQIRNLSVADLLTRVPVGLDGAPLRQLVAGRRVLITGAGGSIGSELCRQLARLGPAALILVERYENALYEVANQIADSRYTGRVAAAIADITNEDRIRGIFIEQRPDIVFHAAAHKHVPLMEQNPCEAIKNNVAGTRVLMEIAEETGVDRFVLISTDKAVNPSSVMGATKRVAELMAQARNGPTAFITVRFGNVLGSNGSVVPRFMEQIRAGGPVTVTDREVQRYFMLIPEAVQLVLHAAAHGQAGATYVLDMGEQIKIVDLARNLIRLSGFVPDQDVAIEFTGLRPGEKLREELVGPDEVSMPSAVEKVLRVVPQTQPDLSTLLCYVHALEDVAQAGDSSAALEAFGRLVPGFGGTAVASVSLPNDVDVAMASAAGVSCPACQSTKVHRSRSRSKIERLRKGVTRDRLYRCGACGWRGWLEVREVAPPMADASHPAPNLESIDYAVAQTSSLKPPVVNPSTIRNFT